jgi:hypothetical protein
MSELTRIEELALKAAGENEPEIKNFRITNRAPNILDGWLITVSGDKPDRTNLDIYVLVRNGSSEVYYDLEEFAKAASKVEPRGLTALERVVTSIGLPGTLALLIVSAILYLIIARDASQIPSILENSLATIIGFYFGTKAMEKAKT